MLEAKSPYIKTYKITDQKLKSKLLTRFYDRLFWLEDVAELKRGWLGQLYERTNGIDLLNYYLVPYNKHFNPKPYSFDEYYREWIVDQESGNEILADIYACMTDTNERNIIG